MGVGVVVIVVGAAVVLGHALQWAIGRNALPFGAASAPDQPTSDADAQRQEYSAAVLAYALSGAEGSPCRVLDVSATSTVLELVGTGAVGIARITGDDLILSIDSSAPEPPDPIHRMVLTHLRSRGWKPTGEHQKQPIVSTGTLSSHPPGRMWWARFRSAVADQSLAAGLTRRRVPTSVMPVLAGIGAVGAIIGGLHTVVALMSVDIARLNLWWIATGLLGWRLVVDAGFAHLERSDLLTPLGRSIAIRTAHRLDEFTRTTPNDEVSGDPTLALAVAGGIPTRATRSIPIVDRRPSNRYWSSATGTRRVVSISSRWMPADGARPTRVLIGGVASIIAGFVFRSAVKRVAGSTWLVDLQESVPDAFGPLDRHLNVMTSLAIVPIVLGVTAVIIGTVDLAVNRDVSGVVIAVRLPLNHGVWDRVRLALSGVGHDGTAVVEICIDDGSGGPIRPLLVDSRAAAPVGATVLAKRTLILGRVRSLGPTGTSGASLSSGSTVER